MLNGFQPISARAVFWSFSTCATTHVCGHTEIITTRLAEQSLLRHQTVATFLLFLIVKEAHYKSNRCGEHL